MELNGKNLLPGMIGLIIATMMVTVLLVPITAQSDSDLKTEFENEGSGTYKLDGVDDYVLRTNPDNRLFTINGEPFDIGSVGTPYIITDKCRIVPAGHFIQIFGINTTRIWNYNAQNYLQVFDYTAATKTLVCTAYNGLTDTAEVLSTQTFTVENIIYIYPEGDYTSLAYTEGMQYYVNDPSEIIAGGVYTTGSLKTTYFSEGSTVYVGQESYTGSATYTQNEIDGYLGIYECSDYTIEIEDGSTSEEFTPYFICVPKTVAAHTPTTESYSSILGILPILVLAGIVIGVVGSFIRNRD